MKFFIHVPEGEILPRYYGVVCRKLWQPGSLCAPVPFNRIIRAARTFWFWFAFPPVSEFDQWQVAYDAGWRDAMGSHRVEYYDEAF